MSATLVPRVYRGFRGVDFRGDEIDLTRSPDCLNVWKDYKETDSIRTRPEMKLLSSFSETVYGVFFYTLGSLEMTLVHSGTKLYKIANGITEELYTGLKAASSEAFIFNNVWYFKDGINYLQYDGQTIGEVAGYIPTTSISGKPSPDGVIPGGRTTHEDVNMLSDWRINTFIGDENGTVFFLDARNIEAVSEVSIDGVPNAIPWQWDAETGKITFIKAPPAPLTDGQDNISIKFRKSIDKSKIYNCTLLQVFDNRVFFSGNPDYPNMIWHSSLNDPTYCSDLDYYNEGLDYAKVKGMVAGNNVLWVFKEPSQANTTVFYHTPTIDSEYGKIYPNTHSSISTGCIGKAINFNDDIIFFSDRGMEGINGDITTEQVIAHRSSLVDRKLIAESNYEDMILEEWEGYLVVIIDNKVYLADSRAVFTNEDHIEYEWYYWELDKKITCAKVNRGVLYLGTYDGGVYTMTDTESAVESYWVTPKDKFMYPQYMKTTNKKGCVAESTGDISVYAKTDKTDFELISTHLGITDKFVCRIKRKKFKDIQLKFHSNTRFTLESATLECFVGGYLKR